MYCAAERRELKQVNEASLKWILAPVLRVRLLTLKY
jgi:hypothetical protein